MQAHSFSIDAGIVGAQITLDGAGAFSNLQQIMLYLQRADAGTNFPSVQIGRDFYSYQAVNPTGTPPSGTRAAIRLTIYADNGYSAEWADVTGF